MQHLRGWMKESCLVVKVWGREVKTEYIRDELATYFQLTCLNCVITWLEHVTWAVLVGTYNNNIIISDEIYVTKCNRPRTCDEQFLYVMLIMVTWWRHYMMTFCMVESWRRVVNWWSAGSKVKPWDYVNLQPDSSVTSFLGCSTHGCSVRYST